MTSKPVLRKTMSPIERNGVPEWWRGECSFISTPPYIFMEVFLSTGNEPSGYLTVPRILLCHHFIKSEYTTRWQWSIFKMPPEPVADRL
jgi:hypothetical protein